MKYLLLTPVVDATDWNKVGKPNAEQILTDGCGYANLALLQLAERFYRHDTYPRAIQMRFRGAKVCISSMASLLSPITIDRGC
jgi:hypothetical protein